MAQINFVSESSAVALGAADELAEFLDRNRGFTRPFMNVTDWVRIGSTALAGATVVMSRNRMMQDIAEPVLYSGSTLSVKSISRLVREGFASPASRRYSERSAMRERANGRRAIGPGATIDAPEVSNGRVIKITSI